MYIMAFLVVYTCVLFLPSMHERYGYLYEVMSILLAVMIPRMIMPCIGLLGISLNTYSNYLFANEMNIVGLAYFNVFIYIVCLCILSRELVHEVEVPKRESVLN